MSIKNPTTEINSVAQEQIDQIAEKCAKIKPLVAINCITYNHEKYLRDALDGFIMQKTEFPFVAIVHDDASTDGTAAILREYADKYPDIILPIYETENQYSKRDGSLGRTMHKARNATGAKYIAYCEGDDYWTKPQKLQMQVDYLEAHPECSLVCHNYDKYLQESKSLAPFEQLRKKGRCEFKDLIIYDFVATLTVVIRSRILNDYRNFVKGAPNWSFNDYPKWLFASTKGYLNVSCENMATYRILGESASHGLNDISKLRWAKSEFSMFDYINHRIEMPKNIKRDALFFRCNRFGNLSIALGDSDLKNRIKSFYWENRFFIAWLSFILMDKYPKLTPFLNIIEQRLYLKAPSMYLQSVLKKYRKHD